MKVCVNQENCIGCGMCIDVCPEAFEYNADSKSELKKGINLDVLEDKIKEAQSVCPVDAIEIE